jgi:hypothetical protein
MEEDLSAVPDGGESAMRSVTTFLDRERARRRSARRTWLGLLGLLGVVGLLHGLTVAGWIPPEGRDILASASAVGFGLLAQL